MKRREVSLSSSRRSSISERGSARGRGSARRLYDNELTRALYDDSGHKIATGPGRHADPLVPDLDLRPRSARVQESPRSGRRGRIPKAQKQAAESARLAAAAHEHRPEDKPSSRKRGREPSQEPEKKVKRARTGLWFLTDNFLVRFFSGIKTKLFG
ncbi:hypothetical protein BEWA_002160 [Theileria equi strain WA]|uniref:Uncharacterized protein n=1 Tax=Theileria equi strain WA TaxID=1537102 RepID=L0B0Z6_THEEQ|nr:hypothetical protein BEWA_002160 [Theileria equi strain WA]AFZ80809.1 hypothetical protein BEWA_002160 [Theileria equi strain WA]|eukprot:XP_004830475.1 hypothetical protein BEWA_002160 [Theileria equi strain WA]